MTGAELSSGDPNAPLVNSARIFQSPDRRRLRSAGFSDAGLETLHTANRQRVLVLVRVDGRIVAERPLYCVAEGAARCLAIPDVVRAYEDTFLDAA